MTSRSSSQSTATSTPDLTGMKIAHRAMLDDTRRFAEILGRIGAGEPCDDRRRRAIGDYLTQLCASIHHHHTIEDEIVWPILTASAGAAVDVRELQDDHTELKALLAVLGTHVGGFARARSGDTRAAGNLAETLRQTHELLAEHIADEEKVVFPIVDRYVSVTDWDRVEKAARTGGKMSFEAPRMFRHADACELAKMRKEAGPIIRAVLGLLIRSYDKREAIIVGQAR
ncbi:hypothetical protein GONAM_10_00370 [Gordonia namibiensis NBRC 108229]|uniref:Hemerythrin-like domain-containing protein n=1 Tax=Gordonia namibiensis NBRC 108229 TaxID=1208314 RepID=K6X0H6_9ACTN|nr:hemerythrin domain-containing protein [Gordonia namibiensis]GAB99566.1 hypothetical protein GONAM_10_00370 [Gordonia namibiensis NBRC 108229]